MKALFLLLLSPSLVGAATIYTGTYMVNTVVPDNDETGLLVSQTLSFTGITSIESIQVLLNLSGGWNGDLYAYLAHESGFVVLLNRIGRTSLNAEGSGSSGFDVVFDDGGDDIHLGAFAWGSEISGTYGPDGRLDDPDDVTDDDSQRTALLASFAGLPGDGLWELFIADLGAGDQATLVSWGLRLEQAGASAIPEPAAMPALAALVAAALGLRRRAPR